MLCLLKGFLKWCLMGIKCPFCLNCSREDLQLVPHQCLKTFSPFFFFLFFLSSASFSQHFFWYPLSQLQGKIPPLHNGVSHRAPGQLPSQKNKTKQNQINKQKNRQDIHQKGLGKPSLSLHFQAWDALDTLPNCSS